MDQVDLNEIYNHCREAKTIVLDLETTGLNWIWNEILYIGLCLGPEELYFIDFNEPGVKDFLIDLLKLKVRFSGQNIKFDLHFLARFGLPDNVDDTMIKSQLINENGLHNLDYLTETYLNEGHNYFTNILKAYKKEHKIKNFIDFPEEIIRNYCMEQCLNTYELDEIFTKKIRESGLEDVYLVEKKFLKVLLRMEQTGVLIDVDYLNKLQWRLEKEADGIRELFPKDLNLGSSKQVGKYLTERGVEPVLFTPKGNPSWSEEAIKLINDSQAKKIARYRSVKHTISTFVEAYLEALYQGRLHCQFKQIGARTGRQSCVEPNLQQVPQGSLIRKAFIGEKNIAFFDYDQMEALLFGHFCNDKDFIRRAKNSKDIYADFAKFMFGVSDPFISFKDSTYRDITKQVVLGLIYGMGDKKLEKIISESSSSSKSIQELFPTYKKYKEKVETEAKENRYTTTILGRRRHLLPFEIYKTINAIVQGSAADIVKLVMVTMPEYLQKKMVLSVHDSLMFENLENREAKEVKEVMCDFNLRIPLRVSYGVANNWAEAEKKAKIK